MGDLNHFMGLPYRMEIEPIPDDEGGGYCASIPQLGRYAFRADGETPDEAIRNLEEVKRDLFTTYLEEGVEIPEPEPDDEAYSGKFVIRIPKELHRDLSIRAKENNVSLNQFVLYLLSRQIPAERSSKEPEPPKRRRNTLMDYVASIPPRSDRNPVYDLDIGIGRAKVA